MNHPNAPQPDTDSVSWTPEGIIMLALTGLEGEKARTVREAVMDYVMGRGPRNAIWNVLGLPAPHRSIPRIHADGVAATPTEEQLHLQIEGVGGRTLYCIAVALADSDTTQTTYPTLAELRTAALAILDVADRTDAPLHSAPLNPNLTQEVFAQQ